MKYIREILRNIKYKIKFLGKKKNMSFSYLSNSKNNNQLTDLMNLFGSDKGGRNNHHNFASYYSEIFFESIDFDGVGRVAWYCLHNYPT